MITLQEIKAKDRICRGVKYEGKVERGHKADIEIDKYIRLYGQEWNHVKAPMDFDITFKVGDKAEHDSHNLSYIGVITAIKEKYVEIEEYGEKHRLSIWEFSWRNHDFNLSKLSKSNAETMVTL